MRFFRFHSSTLTLGVVLALTIATPLFQQAVYGQATNAAGAIQGTITDPKGGNLPGAYITILSLGTGAKKTLTSDSAGFYSVASLVPGEYQVTVEAPGFSKTSTKLTVKIGTTSNGDLKLKVGAATEEVIVSSDALQVNTVQSTVSGVLTDEQIDNLPISGRNFLDLSQLEPGVQLQDGSGFDPTKGGYSSVSFNGVNGRTARILLDGQDISDETVGTSVVNVSAGAIEEFQMSRSSLDISNELTSSGAVTVSTRSGTNQYHGQVFGLLRDQRAGDALTIGGTDYYFQREQFGVRAGGPVIKDKLFFFGDSERLKQDSFNSYEVPNPFSSFSGGWGSPLRGTYSTGRIDYNAPKGIHMFFRGAYENNLSASNFNEGYTRYSNKDNTPIWAGGADFITGKFTHSLRGSYLKFHNLLGDDSAGLPDPIKDARVYLSIHGFRAGPNPNAPQQTFQSDKQLRYDAGVTIKSHVLGYGVSLNRILGGGLAAFFNNGPEVSGSGAFSKGVEDCANVATPPGPKPGVNCVLGGSHDPTDPTAYLTSVFEMGNGEGYSTERAQFGLPAGGQSDWRIGLYLGDTWKVLPKLSVNYGLRVSRDTGRTDSDLAPTPCSDAVATFGAASPCTTGNLLDSLTQGLGERVHQPSANWGPKAGFAYDLTGNGKTVIRGGLGLYFENSVFNNVLFDRETRLSKGLFFGSEELTPATLAASMPDGTTVSSVTVNGTTKTIAELWTDAISVSAPYWAELQQLYQANTKKVGAASNGLYVANTLTESGDTTGTYIYAPKYKTARSVQINIGVQRELWKGAILSADYLRNIGEHFMQSIDENHVGDAKYLDKSVANAAIAATLKAFDATTIDQAIVNGATIADFAGNGLDSGISVTGGFPSAGLAAFGGKNPAFGEMSIVYPQGRSVYNGLQASLRQETRIPVSAIKGSSFEISYTLSRFLTTAGGAGENGQTASADQNFTPTSWDNNHPTKNMGPGGLDRRQQYSFGGNFTWRGGLDSSIIGHYYSPLSTNLYLDSGGNTAGEIFQSDVTGDGTVQDVVPGLKPGAFMRSVTPQNLAKVIANYNSTYSGQLTPAGNALVSNNFFTSSQLTQLGAVTRTIAAPIAGNVGNGNFKSLDLVLGRPIKVARLGEKFSLDPTVSFFNLFNFVNYNFSASGLITGNMNSEVQPGSVNGTDSSYSSNDQYNRNSLRTGNGSGVFGQGVSRVIEYGMKINF